MSQSSQFDQSTLADVQTVQNLTMFAAMVVVTILSRSWPGNLSWARLSKVRRTSPEIVARVRRPLLHPLDVSAWTVKAFFPFPLISVIRASCFRDVTIEREPARGGGHYALFVFSYKPIDTEFRVPGCSATNTGLNLRFHNDWFGLAMLWIEIGTTVVELSLGNLEC